MKHGKLIESMAATFKLEVPFLASVIWQESAGNEYAIRYEHGFYLRYINSALADELPGYFPHPIPTAATERRLRACSFGLMQIMGNTARLSGFKGEWLTQLFNPEINLAIGCGYLLKWLLSCGGDQRAALLKYNGGAEKSYPDIIFDHVQSGAFKNLW